MLYSPNNQAIQAFPITSATFIGVPTNQDCAKKLVHMNEEGEVTFHFPSGDIVVPLAPAGIDYMVSSDCTGVTSLASVMIG